MDFRLLPHKIEKKKRVADGWEYVGSASNCYVWRKPYTDEKPRSFLTDAQIASRDKKLFYVLLLPFFLMAVLLFYALNAAATRPHSVDVGEMFIVACISVGAMVYLGWALLKLRISMRRAEERPERGR